MTAWWLLLLAVPAMAASVVEHAFELPAGEWRFAEVTTAQPGTVIHAECLVTRGEGPVILEVIAKSQLDAHKTAARRPYLARQGPAQSVRLTAVAGDPGVYAVVVESPEQTAAVRLQIRLEEERLARELPAGQRALITALSLGAFVAILVYAGGRLRPYLRGPAGL